MATSKLTLEVLVEMQLVEVLVEIQLVEVLVVEQVLLKVVHVTAVAQHLGEVMLLL